MLAFSAELSSLKDGKSVLSVNGRIACIAGCQLNSRPWINSCANQRRKRCLTIMGSFHICERRIDAVVHGQK